MGLPDRPPAAIRQEALSIKEAAIVLGVHEDTVRAWVHTGVLEGYRVGLKLIRIPRSAIARLRTTRLTRADC